MIYSPTQTTLWLQCRMKRALHNQGWRLKEAGRRDLAAILSSAVHAGLAAYNQRRYSSGVGGLSHAVASAEEAALAALNDLHAEGRHVGEYNVAQRDAIVARAAKAVTRYIAEDPIPLEWQIRSVEVPSDESGARPDLVVDDGRGPCPVDYKVKLSLKREYEAKEIGSWRDSWQLYHYANTVCSPGPYRYYVALVVCEPFRVQLLPFEVNDKTMEWWRESAAVYYHAMEQEDAVWPPPMAAKHADEFGECEYRRACFEHQLDPQRMRQDYVRLAQGIE